MSEPQPINPPAPRHGHRRRLDELPAEPSVWPAVLFYAFAAGWLVATALLVAGFEPPARWRWTEGLLPLLAAFAVAGTLLRRLPLQNAVCIAAIALVFTGGIMACGVTSGVPFGLIRFTERADPKLWDRLPVWIPLWWTAIVIASRETIRVVLQPYRKDRQYGIWMVIFAAVLAMLMALSWEPFGVRVKSLWVWQTSERTVCWYGAPWVNFVGWLATAVVTLGFCSPWLIAKHPVKTGLSLYPALLWALINLHFTIGNALRGIWLAAGVGVALSATVVWLAWRGLKFAEANPPGPRPAPQSPPGAS
ncbi:MAG: carotenoid biosynthesis protein [Verrucomicrobia bacterium]|nr:carotenoid biosynthesis protein [Verrucomicrobiota bacterium]